MILPFVLIFVLGSVEYAAGACNTCSPTSRVQCVSETSFKACKADPNNPGTWVDDPNALVSPCPDGKICVDNKAICVAGGTPFCENKCGKCNNDKVFACVSDKKYAFCFGETTPSSAYIGTCSSTEFCDVNKGDGYCSATPTCLDGESHIPTPPPPTTPTTSPTTGSTGSTGTTPTPPTTSPNDYCKTRPTGRYPVTGSCTNYIYCYPLAGSMVGEQYACPQTTVFDPKLQRCVLATAYPCV